MAAKRNKSGKTWKEHAAPHLRNALKAASRTWKPKKDRTNHEKVAKLRQMRAKINQDIKREIEKG